MAPIDEDYARMIATAGGMVTAGLTVFDTMVNGIVASGTHLAVGLVALVTVRIVLWRFMRPTPSPTPSTPPTPVPVPVPTGD
jgi:cytochrome b561